MSILRYRKTNRNQINMLFTELVEARHEIERTFRTPTKQMPQLNKAFALDGLDCWESFVIMKLAEEKKILSFGKN